MFVGRKYRKGVRLAFMNYARGGNAWFDTFWPCTHILIWFLVLVKLHILCIPANVRGVVMLLAAVVLLVSSPLIKCSEMNALDLLIALGLPGRGCVLHLSATTASGVSFICPLSRSPTTMTTTLKCDWPSSSPWRSPRTATDEHTVPFSSAQGEHLNAALTQHSDSGLYRIPSVAMISCDMSLQRRLSEDNAIRDG
ncbi:unnamed protein product [Polarella glacialis]|uniref:Uncharacterized protein n=1 Tax=Polarella glacialis TaxID=89957 RepID=A0A813JUQ3_POLGL|nr:unnamed protein product [Polarella glacialis]